MADVPPDFEDARPEDARVEVRSTWRDVIVGSNTVSTETRPLECVEIETQTGSRDNNGTQTDDQGGRPPSPTKLKASGLSEFVQKVEDMVAGELVKATEEAEVLEPFTRPADEEQEPAACVHFLSPFQPDDSATADLNATSSQLNKHKLVVTCLSWSSTGQTIAASYGRYDVVGWCTYPGSLTTWNLGREEVNTMRPDVRIDTDTCLMSCAFHPAHPALIAGGTFNGELYVWDLSQEGDMQRGRSDVLLDVRHMEPILSITWQYNLTDATRYGTKDKSYRLVTLGADGRVLTWLWHKLDAPIFGHQLLFPQPNVDRKFVWGGSCMAFQREPRGASVAAASGKDAGKDGGGGGGGISGVGGEGTFLVGTEGGKIFKCYNDANDVNTKEFSRAVAAGERFDLRTPVKEAGYQAHAGAVFGLDCSPFQRDLFLTSSTDGSVRLYSSLNKQPLLHLEPTSAYLFAVQWSPFRPLVFAAAAADGCVYVYDLMRGQEVIRPVLTLDTNGMRKPVYALAFNTRKPDLLATGDATGIQIWRLPSSLTAVRRGEETTLQKMARADDVMEMLHSNRRNR
ncbi:WD repeat-containing protein 34 [Pleodorina starrii]|uniref:WD repeat-containing protein 34 n=1 Tax=Pleodorina starrii TaxID=330485 RepID=A0A9W6F4R1_9CHLO|nr:WD repeat-containing protein 34 [Pleodorina starrii]GLC56174.1 WD repeat-containing protein 34 [Pleodorina starrii]GLC74940.1 WD repeat-containing protein 34 [Pleodorina starrii]